MKNFFLFLIFFLFTACSSFENVGKVMRNEKIKTTDEFLVEKRKTLVLHPDFNKIPKPGALDNKKTNNKSIKDILKGSAEENTKINKSSNLEKSILNNIRK